MHRRQYRKARGPRRGPWTLFQPGDNPIDIDRGGGGHMCVFRAKIATDSGRNLPPIPVEGCHGFRLKAAIASGCNLPPLQESWRTRRRRQTPLGILPLSQLRREEQRPAQRGAMRQGRDVVRLKGACGLRDRTMAHSLRGSRPTDAAYVRRAQAAALAWPLPDALDATVLDSPLCATAAPTSVARRPLPHWGTVPRARTRQGGTLVLVWQESQALTPTGLQYRQGWEAERQGAGPLALGMRPSHRAGEPLLVDSPGPTIPVVAPLPGAVPAAALFLAGLGASHARCAEAPWSQRLPDWMGADVRACAARGGGPRA